MLCKFKEKKSSVKLKKTAFLSFDFLKSQLLQSSWITWVGEMAI